MTRCILFQIATLLAVFLFCSQSLAEVDISQYDYNSATLETAIKGKGHMVLFYTTPEQCQDCREARTLLHELIEIYNREESPVTVAELDCSQNTEYCTKLEVKSFPEFHFFSAGGGKRVKYIGDVKKDDVVQFIEEQSKSGDSVVSKNSLYELTKDTFKSFIADGNHFIKFYAPWCGHCKKLAPTWEDLAKDTESEDVKISKVDCTSHQEICRDYGVRGYPTLKFFGSGEEVASYSGARSLEALKTFVKEQIQKRSVQPGDEAAAVVEEELVQSPVKELTDKNFADVTSSGNAFVKFYAPWCGHCKRLAPTWEDLAKEVSDLPDVSIAKIDCTVYKEICSENEVRGYPTLFLFKNGVREEKYSKGRDLESLKSYLTGQFTKDEL